MVTALLAALAALAESDERLIAESTALPAKTPGVYIDDPYINLQPVTGRMIVCGNCAGDDPLPRKTLLAADESCASCGSHSYVMASTFFQSIQRRNAL